MFVLKPPWDSFLNTRCLSGETLPQNIHTISGKEKHVIIYVTSVCTRRFFRMPRKLVFLLGCEPFPYETFPSVVFRKHQKQRGLQTCASVLQRKEVHILKCMHLKVGSMLPAPGLWVMFTKSLPEVPHGNGQLISRENVFGHWKWIRGLSR